MTKEFQKELREKVTLGVKPSDLRKLKRSKSADDLPNSSLSPPLELEIESKELEKQLESATQTIAELTKIAQKNSLIEDQLKAKQQEVEQLRKNLEEKNEELKKLKTNHSNLLDTNLTLKHQSLKD
jgi:molecular chaperone GrpE (heat shock protein)